jgi:hypothetical protein
MTTVRNANEPNRRIEPGTAGGVLDTIADGLSFILERPRLMVLPFVVDLVLWLLVNVSLMPLANNVARFLETSGATDSDVAADSLRKLGERLQVSDSLSAFLPSIFSGLPLDTLLNVLVTMMSPNVGFGIDRDTIYDTWGSGLFGGWTPASAGAVALIGLICLIGGTFLLALYRVPLARAVRGDTTSHLLPEIGKAWLHFMGYLLLMAVAVIAAMIPLFFASMVFLILGFNLVFVVTTALFISGGMASIYTLFMVDAMLLHRIGPIRAFTMSRKIGRSYFAQTSRFALTSLLFLLGALHLWSSTVDTVPGIAIALIANAFIGTGLSFASMLFYSDRFRLMNARQRPNKR